ncbi:hypothetical protein ILYODFUR_018737 [Ilyodon furcidens]|uniref:Uncharacterized protein n=1 Tax=Ilyodon furcidens TaxID=33524 RepID=A0ABV0V552_9TELE
MIIYSTYVTSSCFPIHAGDDSLSGRSPETKDMVSPPRRTFPPAQNSPPQVAVHSSARTMTFEQLTLVILLLLMLSSWEPR